MNTVESTSPKATTGQSDRLSAMLLAAKIALVGSAVIIWLVSQVMSGYETISQLNGQVAECRSGAMHCSNIFYSRVGEQVGTIRMFQTFFIFFAAGVALITAMMVWVAWMGSKEPCKEESAT